MTSMLQDGYIFDPDSGRLLSQECQRVAEIIQDYDPTLSLVWIPPEFRETELDKDRPFAIQHAPEGKKPYLIKKLKESEVNADLIAWLWMNDNQRAGNDLLGRMEAERNAQEAIRLHKQYEDMMEKHDFAASLLASPLNTYKHNGVKYQ